LKVSESNTSLKRYVLTPEEMGEYRFVNLGRGSESVEPQGQRTLLAHEDFINWLTDPAVSSHYKRRARMVSIQILSRGLAANAKSVKGVSAGWLRAGLGGTGGSHFYLWYVGGESALGRSLGLASDQFLLRLVRQHDDTDVRMPSTQLDDVVNFSPNEILGNPSDSDESPFSDEQRDFAYVASSPVRIVKGNPGSGKTTTLHLAAGVGRVRRILYITFSRHLQTQAKEYFSYFSPHGVSIDVFTFAEFLEHLNDDHPGTLNILPPRDAVTSLRAMTPPNKAIGFGPWDGRFDELYAELHSYGVGRALPFEFRTRPACTEAFLKRSDYLKLRNSEIGKQSAEIASALLEQVVETRSLEKLFKGSTMSRRLMEDVNEPMPHGLDGYDSIFIDEIQDFTVAETALLLNVACRIAVRRGQMPLMVFAGDESQTVRPTDFEWGELKDLTRTFFPGVEFDDHNLQSNMRSSRRVAEMIEASASQYDLLPRRERPGGQSSASLDHHLEGSVTYCSLENEDELSELFELARSSSNIRVIHPAGRLPDDLEEFNSEGDIWLADIAKGLEYETVIVMDAGRSQRLLSEAMADMGRKRSSESSSEIVWARTAADRFRVSVSRAVDTLVLIDRQGFDGFRDIESLSERAGIRPPAEVSFGDLEIELRRDTDPVELLNALSTELALLADRDLDKAIRRAGSGRRRLERSMLEEDVPIDVVKRFALACGTVFVYAVTDQMASEGQRAEYVKEARQLFSYGGMAGEFEDLERLMKVMTDEHLESSVAQGAVKAACESRQDLYDRATDVAIILDRMIVRWLRNVLDGDLPLVEDEAREILGSIRTVMSSVADRNSFAKEMAEAELRKWAEKCLQQNRPAMGLEVARGIEGLDELRGQLHEDLGSFDEAIRSFMAAGLAQDAVRCARRSGQLDRAIELDDDSDSSATSSMLRLKAMRDALGDGPLKLVSEERDSLLKDLNSLIDVS
jgi:hypothetical protein